MDFLTKSEIIGILDKIGCNMLLLYEEGIYYRGWILSENMKLACAGSLAVSV